MDIIYYYIAAGFIFLILEILTPTTFFFFSIGIAAFITAAVSFAIKDPNILLMIESVLSIIVYAILWKTKPFKMNNDYKSNIDTYIGKTVKIISIIEENGEHNKYRVKLFGEEWTGVSKAKINIGDEAIVESREGNTLFIK